MKVLRRRFFIPFWLVMGVILIAACGSRASVNNGAPSAPPSPAKLEPTPELVAQVIDPTEIPVALDECLDCHTDKQRLIDTTEPEGEEVESENQGEG